MKNTKETSNISFSQLDAITLNVQAFGDSNIKREDRLTTIYLTSDQDTYLFPGSRIGGTLSLTLAILLTLPQEHLLSAARVTGLLVDTLLSMWAKDYERAKQFLKIIGAACGESTTDLNYLFQRVSLFLCMAEVKEISLKNGSEINRAAGAIADAHLNLRDPQRKLRPISQSMLGKMAPDLFPGLWTTSINSPLMQ